MVGALLKARSDGLVHLALGKMQRGLRLGQEERGDGIKTVLSALEPFGSPRRIQSRGDAQSWGGGGRSSTHHHLSLGAGLWSSSARQQGTLITKSCPPLSPAHTHRYYALNQPNPMLCAALTSDALLTIHLFPLIGVHEPMKIHKDPETIIKTRDHLSKQATQWCLGVGRWWER